MSCDSVRTEPHRNIRTDRQTSERKLRRLMGGFKQLCERVLKGPLTPVKHYFSVVINPCLRFSPHALLTTSFPRPTTRNKQYKYFKSCAKQHYDGDNEWWTVGGTGNFTTTFHMYSWHTGWVNWKILGKLEWIELTWYSEQRIFPRRTMRVW